MRVKQVAKHFALTLGIIWIFSSTNLTSLSTDTALGMVGVGYRVPHILVSTTIIDFGRVKVGQAFNLRFTIYNAGETGSTLVVRKLVISGGNFHFSDSPGIPFMVPAGVADSLRVRFRPTSKGKFSGTITISAEVQKDVEIELRGEGV